MKKKTKDKKDFLWWGLRISFGLMMALYVFIFFIWGTFSIFLLFLLPNLYWVLTIIFLSILVLSILFSFVLPIINLVKKRDKKFSIIVLVFSSLFILLIILLSIFVKNLLNIPIGGLG